MIRAIVQDGAIVPLEPLPPEWRDNTELSVAAVYIAMTPAEIDRSFDELDRLCAAGDPATDDQLEAALTEIEREEKARLRCNCWRSDQCEIVVRPTEPVGVVAPRRRVR